MEILLTILIVIVTIGFYQLIKKVGVIMSAEVKLVEYVQEIDAETTRIATLIEDLINQGTAGDLTEEELITGLQPVVDRLKAVGSTPPVEPPVEEPPIE